MLMIALISLGVLVISVVLLLAYAARKPDTFRVVREISINAPPQQIFPYINDLRRQLTWMPFDRDPAAKRTFSSDTSGKGASYAWDGNRNVGAGRIEILDVSEPARVTMQLDMLKPMKARNEVVFSLDPGESAGGTKVTWAMQGPQPLMGKVISLFIDCGKMCGDDFDRGLAKLKALTEESLAAESQAAQ